MQLRPRVVGAGQAAAAKARGRHPEVAAVLLDEQVGARLRHAEQRVRRAVDRHRRVDAAVIAVLDGQLEARVELDERQLVGQVAVDLVGRAEDERRGRRVPARRLEQVERAVGVDGEVDLGVGRRPVVRGLRRGVDDELDRAAPRARTARRCPRRRGCRAPVEENASPSSRSSRRSCARSTHPARRTTRACRSRSRSRGSRRARNARSTRNRSVRRSL